MDSSARPVVLAFGGTDPTGGAGLQADIEAIAAQGAHAAPVVTAVTVQDTTNVIDFTPQPGELVARQATAVLADLPVDAIKIGMTGSIEAIESIREVLLGHPGIPVVLDPVLAAGGGGALARGDVAEAIRTGLLPHARITTPNSEEARILAPGSSDLAECAARLIEAGAEYVLITGTHEATGPVENTLYDASGPIDTCTWNRLPETYHGSGCTLASALAALLARGLETATAAREAQRYTWNALRRGYRAGRGQWLPDRIHARV